MKIAKVYNSLNFKGLLNLVSNNETKNDKDIAIVINTDDISSFDGKKGHYSNSSFPEYLTNVHMKNGDIITIKHPLSMVLKAYNTAKSKGSEVLYTDDYNSWAHCAEYNK